MQICSAERQPVPGCTHASPRCLPSGASLSPSRRYLPRISATCCGRLSYYQLMTAPGGEHQIPVVYHVEDFALRTPLTLRIHTHTSTRFCAASLPSALCSNFSLRIACQMPAPPPKSITSLLCGYQEQRGNLPRKSKTSNLSASNVYLHLLLSQF